VELDWISWGVARWLLVVVLAGPLQITGAFLKEDQLEHVLFGRLDPAPLMVSVCPAFFKSSSTILAWSPWSS
jgi:hypothetical protein